jgi:hypothetical protein
MNRSVTLTAAEAKEYGLVHELSTALIPSGVQVVNVL